MRTFDKLWCAVLGAGMVQLAITSSWVWFAIYGVVLLIMVFKD